MYIMKLVLEAVLLCSVGGVNACVEADVVCLDGGLDDVAVIGNKVFIGRGAKKLWRLEQNGGTDEWRRRAVHVATRRLTHQQAAAVVPMQTKLDRLWARVQKVSTLS